jgi:hypothetical protein
MPINFTLNAILILALGLVFLAAGVYFALSPFMRIPALGMFALASGCICCGLTDGFSDVSARGLLLRRFGFISFLVGIPLVGYSVYRGI